jgi:hypothetical protein
MRRELDRRNSIPVVADEIHLLSPGARAGHDARRAAATHLEKMRDDGYLEPAETQTRIDRVLASKTRQELLAYTADLPAPADPRTARQKMAGSYNFQKKEWYIPILLFVILAAGCLAALPPAIAGTDHWISTLHGLILCVPSIIIGSVLFTVGSCWLIGKTAKTN